MADIGGVELVLDMRALPLHIPVQLLVRDIRLQAGNESATVPEARLGFAWNVLWPGDSGAPMIPSVIELHGLRLGFAFDGRDGNWRVDGDTAGLIQLVGAMGSAMAADGEDGQAGLSVADFPFARVALRDSPMHLTHPDISPTTIDTIQVEVQRRHDRFFIDARASDPALGVLQVVSHLLLHEPYHGADIKTLGGIHFDLVDSDAVLADRPSVILTHIKSHGFDTNFITRLWPEGVLPTTRNWLRARLGIGVLNDFDLTLALDISTGAVRRFYMDGGGRIAADRLNYLDDMPKLLNAEVQLTLGSKHYVPTTTQIDLLQGAVAGLDTTGSRLLIVNNAGVSDASLTVKARGAFAQAMAVLDSPVMCWRRAVSPRKAAVVIMICPGLSTGNCRGGVLLPATILPLPCQPW